ncbi:MAG: hypothetical protein WCP19_13825, partial [Chloroflexota bacterium]
AEQAGVEDVHSFGDRLHIRVEAHQSENVIQNLQQVIPARGGTFYDARSIPTVLEDVFIALSDTEI